MSQVSQSDLSGKQPNTSITDNPGGSGPEGQTSPQEKILATLTKIEHFLAQKTPLEKVAGENAPAAKDVQTADNVTAEQKAPAELKAASQGLPGAKQTSGMEQMLDKAKDKQFIILGDTQHQDAKLPEFLAKPSTMAALKNHGVKRLGLEVRVDMQDAADKIYKAKNEGGPAYTAQDFANEARQKYSVALNDPAIRKAVHQFLEARKGKPLPAFTDGQWATIKNSLLNVAHSRMLAEGRVIESAAEAGIRTMCLEQQKPNLVEHTKFLLNIRTAEERADRAKTPDEKQKAEKVRDDLHSERSAGDRDLADTIKKTVGKEKTVLFYGADHGKGSNDLDEALGDTKRFDLFSSESARLDIKKKDEARPDSAPPAGALMTDGSFIPYDK